jgi:dTDP-4-dehydrorhamnose reductase
MAGHVVFEFLRTKYDPRTIFTHVYRNKVDPDSKILNLYDNTRDLESLIEKANPNVIINCVGILPKQAEKEPEKAAYINSFLPHLLSKKCRVIQISTDCVFSGKDGVQYKTESYPKNEGGIYGVTKSAGELDNDKDFTIRTSIVGPEIKENGSGLFEWFMRQSGAVDGWTNAFWNGVTTLELAKFIYEAIEEGYTGLYNLASRGRTSKYQLLMLFREIYNKDIHIKMKVRDSDVDKTLVSAREDISYRPKSIESLVMSQKIWYPHAEGREARIQKPS